MAIEAKKGFRERVMQGLGRRSAAGMAGRMMPMIDVLFLLLIFFLATSRFHAVESVLPFNLPGENKLVIKTTPLKIFMHQKGGGCAVEISEGEGNSRVELDEGSVEAGLVRFGEAVVEVLEQQGRMSGDPVELICDDAVEWQFIAKIYNVLYGLNMSDITFAISE